MALFTAAAQLQNQCEKWAVETLKLREEALDLGETEEKLAKLMRRYHALNNARALVTEARTVLYGLE